MEKSSHPNSIIKLSISAREELKSQHRRERDGRVRDRIKAVLMRDRGYSYSEIAEALLLDSESVRRHVIEYQRLTKLKPTNGGSQSHLSKHQTKCLLKHLNEYTYKYVKEICYYVKRKYGVSFTISGMTKWLQTHNFRYKKVQPVPAKANPLRQEEFVHEYEELRESCGPEDVIYFLDSVHPQHQTKLGFGWILRGVKKLVKTPAKPLRLTITGAISLNHNHRFIYQNTDRANTLSMKKFLKKLRANHKKNGIIHIILDNAGYHHSNALAAYAALLNIELHFLPPYSPNLNPIERLWKLMHEKTTYNKYYEKFADFTEAIRHFCRHIGKNKTLLRSRITDNFQRLSGELYSAP
jgi:transposase